MKGSDKERRKHNNFEIVNKQKYLFLKKEEWGQKKNERMCLKKQQLPQFFFIQKAGNLKIFLKV